MKRFIIAAAMMLQLPLLCLAQTGDKTADVYFTSEITPEALVKIYKALGKEATGRVAVKISTGESARSNQLDPSLIKNLVDEVNGTLVECNTAYRGNRSSTAAHRRAIAERGYNDIATVDLIDEEGYTDIPVADTKYLKFNRVGTHIVDYAEQIGFGTKAYNLIDIAGGSDGISAAEAESGSARYNVYTLDGVKVLMRQASVQSNREYIS